jgi:hypothetical protein
MTARKKSGRARRVTSPATPIAAIRRAFADYVWSGGCSCCSVPEKLREAEARIAKLLRIPKFSDGSGYNISRFRSTLRRHGDRND